MLTQVHDRETVTHLLTDDRAAHDLTAVRRRHDPCRAVHIRTEVIAVLLRGLPRVHTDSRPQDEPAPATPLRRARSERPRPPSPHRAAARTPRTHRRPCSSPDGHHTRRLRHARPRRGRQRNPHRVGVLLPPCVEPSISVNRNVTVPDGNSAIQPPDSPHRKRSISATPDLSHKPRPRSRTPPPGLSQKHAPSNSTSYPRCADRGRSRTRAHDR